MSKYKRQDSVAAWRVCGNCMAFAQHKDYPLAGLGECRRQRPMVWGSGDEVDQGWPAVNSQDWCLEFVPAPGSAAEVGYLADGDSVNTLKLTYRGENVLHNASIETIGQLCQMTEPQLYRYRNCGPRTIEEIKLALEQHGRRLLFNSEVKDKDQQSEAQVKIVHAMAELTGNK